MSNPVYAKCVWGPYPKKGINEGQIIYFQRKDLRPLSNELDTQNTQFYLNTMRGFWSIICSGDQRLLEYLKDSDMFYAII